MSLESEIAAYMKKLSGPASIEQLFESGFIEAHSSCASTREFFRMAGAANQATMDDWLAGDPDSFVKAHTDFPSWEEMKRSAWVRLANVRQMQLRATDSIEPPIVDGDEFQVIQFNDVLVAR